MQNPQISPAEWFRNAPSFIPAEEVKALKDRATAHIKREREEVLRRAAELEADLRALSGEADPQVEDEDDQAPEPQDVPKPHAAQAVERPEASWSNRLLLTYFAQRNPGARAADYIKFLGSFRPGVAEKTTQSNVYDTLKVLKRDEIVIASGPRGDSQYFYQGGAKKSP